MQFATSSSNIPGYVEILVVRRVFLVGRCDCFRCVGVGISQVAEKLFELVLVGVGVAVQAEEVD